MLTFDWHYNETLLLKVFQNLISVLGRQCRHGGQHGHGGQYEHVILHKYGEYANKLGIWSGPCTGCIWWKVHGKNGGHYQHGRNNQQRIHGAYAEDFWFILVGMVDNMSLVAKVDSKY